MNNPAPILLFTYKRLTTLKESVNALQKNYLASESELYIFSDAAKNEVDKLVIKEVRTYLKTISGFKRIQIIEANVNKGLANSIIDGVSFVMKNFDEVIVLEDDLKVLPNFLLFMNQALSFYRDREDVFSISGYNYDFPVDKYNLFDNYFITRGCSWGWATWKNRWSHLNWDIKTYKDLNSKHFKRSFNFSGSDLHSMLIKQRFGKIDSWAIRWYYNQFIQNKLTVYPILSLIDNRGFDSEATHTKVFNRYKTNFMPNDKWDFNFNPETAVNKYYQEKIQYKFSVISRIVFGKGMTYLKKIGFLK